jgi:hypothetical protein
MILDARGPDVECGSRTVVTEDLNASYRALQAQQRQSQKSPVQCTYREIS